MKPRISDEVLKICSNRDYKFGDKVYAKVNRDVTVKGIIYGRASNVDIYQWYIVKVLGLPKKDAFITVSHDRLRSRVKKVKNV